MVNSVQLSELNCYSSWVATEVGKRLHYRAYGTECALTLIDLQGQRFLETFNYVIEGIIKTTEAQVKGRECNILTRDLIGDVCH